MKCIKCGAEISENANFCPLCGQNNSRIPNYCSHCGSKVELDMKFCENCGNPIEKLPREKEEEAEVRVPDISLEDVADVAKTVVEHMQDKLEPQTHSAEFAAHRTVVNQQSEAVNPQVGGHVAGGPPVRGETPLRAAPSMHRANPNGNTAAAPEAAAPVQPQAAGQTAAPAVSTQQAAPMQNQAPVQTQASVQAQTPIQTQTPVQAQEPVHRAASAPARRQMSHQAPAQTQSVGQVPVQPQPVVNTAAQVASTGAQLGAEVIRTTGAELGAEVIRTTGKVAAEGVKKTVSTGKKIAIITAVVVFIIGALTACLNFFVPAPADAAEDFFVSMEELDYEKMLGCLDKKTESTIRAAMGITGDLLGSFTGISIDLEDVMAFGPSMAPIMDTPDMGIEKVETVFYSDCSQKKILDYCIRANEGGSIPDGYDSDNAIISFLDEYNLTLPGLENLIAQSALVKITLETGEVVYLPLINEGWGDWRIPLMDLSLAMEGVQ